MDEQEKNLLKGKIGSYDYESIKVTRHNEVDSIEKIIKDAVNFKYRVSLAKGMRLAIESMIMAFIMFALIYKANVFSLIYLAFILRYLLTSTNQTDVLIKISSYVSVMFCLQYVLIVMNLNEFTAPQEFPVGLKNYPKDWMNEKTGAPQLAVPWFYHYKWFRDDLSIGYLLGVGVDQQQSDNMIFDFLIMVMLAIYILEFGNPILAKSMKKVYW